MSKQIEIIGIDHGYKNIKTANHTFDTSFSGMTSASDDKRGVLGYKDNYYSIYGQHVSSVQTHNKACSEEFYYLTFVAIAMELKTRKLNNVEIVIAAGLPYRWMEGQKEDFKKMLMKDTKPTFTFEGDTYSVVIKDVLIFPQGICAVLKESNKYMDSILVDIGGETVDIIPFRKGMPIKEESRISTNATIYCHKCIQEKVEAELYERISDDEIIDTIKAGKKTTKDPYIKLVHEELIRYAASIFVLLQEYKINIHRTNIVFCGGGSLIIKNYGEYKENVSFITDINANAKGYELAASLIVKKVT